MNAEKQYTWFQQHQTVQPFANSTLQIVELFVNNTENNRVNYRKKCGGKPFIVCRLKFNGSKKLLPHPGTKPKRQYGYYRMDALVSRHFGKSYSPVGRSRAENHKKIPVMTNLRKAHKNKRQQKNFEHVIRRIWRQTHRHQMGQNHQNFAGHGITQYSRFDKERNSPKIRFGG